MAMVKVCDKCGSPILEKGTRLLWKAEGHETQTLDMCEACTNEFDAVWTKFTNAVPKPDKQEEPKKSDKKNGKKAASEE